MPAACLASGDFPLYLLALPEPRFLSSQSGVSEVKRKPEEAHLTRPMGPDVPSLSASSSPAGGLLRLVLQTLFRGFNYT